MTRYIKIFSLVTIFAFFGMVFLAISTQAQFNKSTIQDTAFADRDRLKPMVPFDHDVHAMYDCNACHHMWVDGELDPHADSIGMECSDCHLAEPEATEMDLIRAYHLMCRTCHQEEKAGPILCGECHTGGN